MALDVAAIIPLIGVFKYADDLSYGVKTLFKNGDEVVDGSRRIIKAADSLGDLSKTGRTVWNHMADSLREMAKNVKKADMLDNARYVDNAVDAVSDTGKRLDDVVGGGLEIPTAFRQTKFASSYDARINQTPSLANRKVQFVGDRGESLCVLKPPPDPELKRLLNEAGVDGILYKNAVPDFSPVSRAEVEIDYMLV